MIWDFSIEAVSPMSAASLLAGNQGNRKLRPSTVAKYAAIMAAGNWRATPEPVMISPNGRLLDGQHRLSAVIASGVTVEMLIVRNVSADVFPALDRGLSRTTADATGLDPKLVETSATLRRAIYGQITTDDDIAALALILSDAFTSLIASCPTTARLFSSAPFRAAACVRLLAGFNPDYVLGTYRGLVLGHVADLPPIAQSLIANVINGAMAKRGGNGAAAQIDRLARAWDVFDPTKANNGKISIRDPETRIAEIRRIVDAAFQASAA